MLAGLWLCVVLAEGSAPSAPADLCRFGLVRSENVNPWADPGATLQHGRAADHRQGLCRLAVAARWHGRDAEYVAAVVDAEWRLAAWRAVWWATDCRFDPRGYLAELRAAVGPAYYRLGVLPAPAPGLWRE
jgi:hypothetical protein